MTSVWLSSVVVEAAALGPDNPLPPLRPLRDLYAGLDASAADPEMAANIAYGHVRSVLPYTLQDGYSRERTATDVTVAVVENEYLRARFLPGFGGRLWSLHDKASGRELLHRNPILQPAHLGLRNAWLAGGVEWNIGTIGHSPLNCAPLHVGMVHQPDGTPTLRMWEFERMRELVFQVDAWAPPGRAALLVGVRVVNPNGVDTPLWWWSNIAVPESADTRVVVPAHAAFRIGSDDVLRRIAVPCRDDGRDETYPGRAAGTADFFYDIPPGRRPFIAALDADGFGLMQVSSAELRGRKLFRWGTSSGGASWQEWLSGPRASYLEVQAGLVRTQHEHLRLPAGGSLAWIEAYAACHAEPSAIHGSWDAAVAEVDAQLDQVLGDCLAVERAKLADWQSIPPRQILQRGSGWGALERRARAAAGRSWPDLPGTPFGDETLGRDQNSWISLLTTGTMPAPPPQCPPSSYLVGPQWRRLLEQAVAGGGNWFTWLHLGVARFHAGDIDGARNAWTASSRAASNAWAERNLAVLDELSGQHEASAARLYYAHLLARGTRALTIEALYALLAANRPADALALIDALDDDDHQHGRIRMLECQAALDSGDLIRAKAQLAGAIVVPDLREGESALDTLWWTYHEKELAARLGVLDAAARVHVRVAHPLPSRYDFRIRDAD